MQFVAIDVTKCKNPLEAEAYKKRIEKKEAKMNKMAVEDDDYYGPVGSNLVKVTVQGDLLLQYHTQQLDLYEVAGRFEAETQDPEQFLRGTGKRKAKYGFEPAMIPTTLDV
jgi:hypothetical protein